MASRRRKPTRRERKAAAEREAWEHTEAIKDDPVVTRFPELLHQLLARLQQHIIRWPPYSKRGVDKGFTDDNGSGDVDIH